jgi:glycosyltransferase involved in cell wall biosynthesis
MMNLLQKYQRYKDIKREKEIIFNLLGSFEFSGSVNNIAPKKINTAVMILPNIYPNLGGVTSALRILTSIQNHGCQVTVAVIGDMDIDAAKRNAVRCMPEFNGEVRRAEDCLENEYDICIATNWNTAYWAQKFSGYKVYFVQDYEPGFYEADDFSYLAKETYSFGYHIISLGKWNIEKIQKNVPNLTGKLNYVDFPYSKSEYVYHDRDYLAYKYKKEINIACYIRYIGRRIPYICEYILSRTKASLETKGYHINIYFFGIDKHNQFKCGKNLGKLSRKELSDLYQKCDFGMVASMSNISLVPYEMLACGLPLIEYQQGSYSYFLGNDTALLIDFDYQTLVSELIEVLEHPEILKEMHQHAEEKLKNLSWNTTCEQFWNIIQSVAKRNEC